MAEVIAAIDDAETALRPIEPRQLAVELDQTLALFDEKRPANWPEIAEFYIEALEDLPADLVRIALRQVRREFRYGWPKPADLRAPAEGELSARRLARLRLGTALQSLERQQ